MVSYKAQVTLSTFEAIKYSTKLIFYLETMNLFNFTVESAVAIVRWSITRRSTGSHQLDSSLNLFHHNHNDDGDGGN